MASRKGSRKKRHRRRSAPVESRPDRSESPVRVPASVRRVDAEGRPDPPWGSVPLSEILVLAGIAFLFWGFIDRRTVAIAIGLVLASLGGLELTVREHLTGFRSHTVILASAVTLVVLATLYYVVGLESWVALAIGAATFAVAFILWRRVFRSASGGYNFRIGGFKG